MNVMKKIATISVIFCIGLSVNGFADNTIDWATQGGIKILGHDEATPLTGSATEGVGFLVQLIYAGDNGIIDAVDIADMDSYGVSGDDAFVAYAWVGRGKPPASREGEFTGPQQTESAKANSKYYIRAWEGTSSSVGTGYMPSDSSTYYGNSALYTFNDSPSPPNEFYISSSFSTTLQAVPEPATVALALAGLGLLIFRRFRKKS